MFIGVEMGKKVAILQSNYIPWKGYFDLIASVDEFILYDDMQYTRRDWRNRNKIKTPHGLQWLTIPVKVRGRYYQKIRDTEIDGTSWAESHWKALYQNYRRSPCFSEVADYLEDLLLGTEYSHLHVINKKLIEWICSFLSIEVKISCSWDYNLIGDKNERLVNLCTQAGGTEYISGLAAKTYIDESVFSSYGIKLTWFNYNGYPEYPQLWGNFVHEVSILDLLFNCGYDSRRYLRYT
ncbi:MAG: WbqC-like protein family [Phormidium sp. OSCR]|nr:MAG: WbqC-like protein family [Phormidium sp. OSCR]